LTLLQVSEPEEAGFSADRLENAYRILEESVAEGVLPAAGLLVSRSGIAVEPRVFGRAAPEADAPPIDRDAIFLVASVTKPVTATAAMMLVERGEITLDDYVASMIPEFGSRGKDKIQVRHLLTHTSGLPDQLPENIQLRKQHLGLDVYVGHIFDCELLFSPGTNVSYQSCGFGILGEIVRRVEGTSLPEFLEREIFQPLGMNNSSLGATKDMYDRITRINIRDVKEYGGPRTDWNWNTEYWWTFAAPWGGMFTTLRDYTIFLQMFLNGGSFLGKRLLSPATVSAMTRNQIIGMRTIPEEVRLLNGWGFGWRLNSPAGLPSFGDLTSPQAYGHTGATGTAVWADPRWNLTYVLFTTQPSPPQRLLRLCANAVIGALGEEASE
jgi:CubicO group peptidase (beta-lactamase class C family)